MQFKPFELMLRERQIAIVHKVTYNTHFSHKKKKKKRNAQKFSCKKSYF